ncbi:ABC transporter permease subunit [Niveispirillum sp. SYP-B3756]|uniref:ABC transporter permease n=1 Tax=Niveispirillum sp. SYP-B3756 TaxID=2662178 RepID=UPI00129285A3|nr:ABC transporter permease [Niveispirillum sp. SYP-B3756]MQP66773.1 ABC transporter permease subunit [Niveispirillum sp. SYP-B3756]
MDMILSSLPSLASGAWLTLQLVALSLALGLLLSVGVALARLSGSVLLRAPAVAFIFLFRSTPLLVQIFLIFYGAGQFVAVRDSFLWPVLREPYWCAIIALTLNNAAYTGEILRGGIQAVSFGQIEAARALGMHRLLLFRRIVLPQAFRQILPAYGNEMIQMVQATSLASTITLMELTGAARAVASRSFQPVEMFVIAGLFYLAMNFAIAQAVRWGEKRLAHAG